MAGLFNKIFIAFLFIVLIPLIFIASCTLVTIGYDVSHLQYKDYNAIVLSKYINFPCIDNSFVALFLYDNGDKYQEKLSKKDWIDLPSPGAKVQVTFDEGRLGTHYNFRVILIER